MDRMEILFWGFAPALVLLFYGVSKGRSAWNDRTTWEAFFAGGLSAVFAMLPGLLAEKLLALLSLGPLSGALAESFFRAAIPEESFKLAALFYIAQRYEAEIGLRDLITLALAVAVGFAAIENLAYLVAPGSWGQVALVRAVTAVPGHALDGLAMGALMTAAVLGENSRLRWALALAVPIVLHGLYDFPLLLIKADKALVGVLPAWFLAFLLAFVAVICLCNRMRAAASRADHHAGSAGIATNSLCTPRQASVVMLLSVPVLVCLKLVLYGGAGIFSVAALSVLPIILAMDLFITPPMQAWAQLS